MSAPLNWIRFFSTRWIASILLVLGMSVHSSWAVSADFFPIHRKILAIYDTNEGVTSDTSKIFANCHTILNYLGLIVDYHDVNQPLPGPQAMAEYRGILTLFASSGIKDPQRYLKWLAEQVKQEKKLVFIGTMGFSEGKLPPDLQRLAKTVYAHLGLEHGGNFTSHRMRLRYATVNPAMVNFERRYPPLPKQYEQFKPLNNSVTVHLSLTRTDRPDSESAVVVTGPGGGLIWGEYALWQEVSPPYRRQWYVNPFAFFTAALDLDGIPKPDPTTLNGRRIAFSHIDGDGFAGFTELKKNATCADVVRDRILKRYPFPVTVSVIVGEIDPKANGDADRVAQARKIFALPNVEAASHSYSHPFYWDPDFDNTMAKYPSQYGMKIPGYEFDSATEIDYSVRYITEHLAPPGKPCRVFLWTGNTKPMASHIRRCDDLGLLNMNGGDTIFDRVSDSYTGVAPLYRNIEGRYQFHIGQVNENILTNLWEGPYYGYREIITTMTRTGTPRRIKPIDIYYHFYSGQYEASVGALESVYTWALAQPIFPMFTSAYIQVLKNWLTCRLLRDDSRLRYAVENYGDCLTVRFDDEHRVPDLSRCINVIGFFNDEQGLYVHLSPGHPRAEITFSSQAITPLASGRHPYIQTANGWIRNFEATGDRIRFIFDGFGPGQVALAGLLPGRQWRLSGQAADKQTATLMADDRGVLVLSELGNGSVEIGLR